MDGGLRDEIIRGDCLEVMRDIPDNSVDLTVESVGLDRRGVWGNHLTK